jgi:hypothetical protein
MDEGALDNDTSPARYNAAKLAWDRRIAFLAPELNRD